MYEAHCSKNGKIKRTNVTIWIVYVPLQNHNQSVQEILNGHNFHQNLLSYDGHLK